MGRRASGNGPDPPHRGPAGEYDGFLHHRSFAPPPEPTVGFPLASAGRFPAVALTGPGPNLRFTRVPDSQGAGRRCVRPATGTGPVAGPGVARGGSRPAPSTSPPRYRPTRSRPTTSETRTWSASAGWPQPRCWRPPLRRPPRPPPTKTSPQTLPRGLCQRTRPPTQGTNTITSLLVDDITFAPGSAWADRHRADGSGRQPERIDGHRPAVPPVLECRRGRRRPGGPTSPPAGRPWTSPSGRPNSRRSRPNYLGVALVDPPSQIPASEKLWVGIGFDDANGTTRATPAPDAKPGVQPVDRPTVGSVADAMFLTNTPGSFLGVNDPTVVRLILQRGPRAERRVPVRGQPRAGASRGAGRRLGGHGRVRGSTAKVDPSLALMTPPTRHSSSARRRDGRYLPVPVRQYWVVAGQPLGLGHWRALRRRKNQCKPRA